MSIIQFDNITSYLSSVIVSGNTCTLTNNINLYMTSDLAVYDPHKDMSFGYINLNGYQTFDGSGNTIFIYQNNSTPYSYHGLFGNTNVTLNNTIKNVTIQLTTASGTINMVYNSGGFIYTYGCTGMTIYNCYFIGDIRNNGVGCNSGIVSSGSYNLTIHDCTVSGNIYSNTSGGICGSSCNNINIYNCQYHGDISATESGGICGSTCYDIKIYHCNVFGNILSTSRGCGGIVGSSFGFGGRDGVNFIRNCFYKGSIAQTPLSDKYNGALCGIDCCNIVTISKTIAYISPSSTSSSPISNVNSFANINSLSPFIGLFGNCISFSPPNISIYNTYTNNYYYPLIAATSTNAFPNIHATYGNNLVSHYITGPYDASGIYKQYVTNNSYTDTSLYDGITWIYSSTNDYPTLNNYIDITYGNHRYYNDVSINNIIYNSFDINLSTITIDLSDNIANFPSYSPLSPNNYIVLDLSPSPIQFTNKIGFNLSVPLHGTGDFIVKYSYGASVHDVTTDSSQPQYYIGDAHSGTISLYTNHFSQFLVDFTNVPCIGEDTLILMEDNTYKRIDEIVRGDFVKCYTKMLPVSKITKTIYKSNLFCNYCIIPKDTEFNQTKLFEPLLITGYHPILINDRRIPVEHLKFALLNNNKKIYLDCKKQLINKNTILYDLQFDEPTYYNANGIWIQSSSPYTSCHPLDQELYWDKSKYKDILTTDDPEYYNEPLILKPMYDNDIELVNNVYSFNKSKLYKLKK
jgi:hypothetical protein